MYNQFLFRLSIANVFSPVFLEWRSLPHASLQKLSLFPHMESLDTTQILVFAHGNNKAGFQITEYTTVKDLRQRAAQTFRIAPDSIGLSLKQDNRKVTLGEDSMKVSEFSIRANDVVYVKNLGRQIRWDLVFYIEYLGPIIIVPAFYLLGKRQSYTWVQPVAAGMAIAHFLKRQLQTAFVHVFSRKTMPFSRVFINSSHYWILFALLNSIELFMFPKATKWSNRDILILFLVWAFMEFCNYKCHKELSSFRKNPSDKTSRKIPHGYGFKYVACANYLWESLGWVTFSLLTRCYSSWAFTGVSIVQMAQWAMKKHSAYQKQFGLRYPRSRKALIPFIL